MRLYKFAYVCEWVHCFPPWQIRVTNADPNLPPLSVAGTDELEWSIILFHTLRPRPFCRSRGCVLQRILWQHEDKIISTKLTDNLPILCKSGLWSPPPPFPRKRLALVAWGRVDKGHAQGHIRGKRYHHRKPRGHVRVVRYEVFPTEGGTVCSVPRRTSYVWHRCDLRCAFQYQFQFSLQNCSNYKTSTFRFSCQ